MPENIVYVPPVTRDIQAAIIGTLRRFTAAGEIDRMTVKPDYRGDSVVPTALHYRATHRHKKGSFDPKIRIW